MSARGLVVDDNSLVREALRFMPTQLELQAVYLHQRAIAPAPMDNLRSALCAPDGPIADSSEDHLPAALKQRTDMPGRNLKIVIVEDDPSMRQAIERILHTAGHNAKWYESAEAVVDMETVMAADCLILDIELPGMSGLELYRTLTRSGLTTPAIFVTALEGQNMRDDAERRGAANYLTKPFSGRALLTAVAEATGLD